MSGHLGLLSKRQDIDTWIEESDGRNPSVIESRRKLRLVKQLRVFAKDKLDMPVGKAYSTYVPLKEDYVVWNVFAASALDTKPKTWCYPLIGCAHYRGYYKKSAAQSYAADLQKKGYETYVAGVKAYSTLGWFDDPVLSTFLTKQDQQLAALLFHEIAHRIAFAKGDTSFNESFATALEAFSLESWVADQNTAQDRSGYAEYLLQKEASQRFVNIVLAKRATLQTLYLNNQLSDVEKILAKKQLFDALREEMSLLDQDYGYVNVYSAWAKDLNNAKLVPVASYNEWVPAISSKLSEILSMHHCNLPASKLDSSNCLRGLDVFYQEIKRVAKLPKPQRSVLLEEWATRQSNSERLSQSGLE